LPPTSPTTKTTPANKRLRARDTAHLPRSITVELQMAVVGGENLSPS